MIDRKRGVTEIGFTHNNSVLVISTHPHTRIRVNITDFSASDGEEDATAPGGYSETILTGDGKVAIHGSWKERSRIQVIWAEYGELKDGRIVINPVYDDSDGTVHAENDDPFTTMATLIRNFGSLEYITD